MTSIILAAVVAASLCFVDGLSCGPPSNLNTGPVGNCAATVTAFPPDPCTECCGRYSRDGTGNERAVATSSIYQHPWVAMVEYEVRNQIKSLCLGSLISGKYVLTAAHCVSQQIHKFGTPKNIRLGEYDTSNEGPDCVPSATGNLECTEGAIVIPIEKIIPHPDYEVKRNDIALIRMQRMVPFTDFIRPICLPQMDLTLTPPTTSTNFTLIAASWGNINKVNNKTKINVDLDLPFVNLETCQRDFYAGKSRNVALWNKQFCAGGELGKDTCKGDGGGPLIYATDRTYEVIGITSFGAVPCGLGIPGVYTNVYEYTAWIRKTIEA